MKLIRNSAVYTLNSIVPALIGFFLIPFYLRNISLEQYGFLSILMMLNAFLAIFMSMQSHSSIAKFFLIYENDPEKQKVYLSSLLLVTIILSSIAFLICYFITPLLKGFLEISSLPDSVIYLTVLFSYLGVIRIFFESINRILQNASDILVSTIVYSVSNIIAAYVLLAVYDMGLKGIIISLLLANALTLAYYIWLNRKYFCFNFSLSILTDPIKFSVFITPHALSKNIYMMADRLILIKFVSAADLGIYTIVDKVANLVKIFTSNFGKAFTPFFLTSKHNSEEIDLSLYTCFSNYFFLGCIVGLSVIIEMVLNFIHPESTVYSSVGLVLAYAFIFKNLEMHLANYLLDAKRTGVISIISTVSCIFNIVLNITLIPIYGMYGAAISRIVSYFLGLILAYYFVVIRYKYTALPTKKILFDFILASAIIVMAYHSNVYIKIALFLTYIIYGAVFGYKSVLLNILHWIKKKHGKSHDYC